MTNKMLKIKLMKQCKDRIMNRVMQTMRSMGVILIRCLGKLVSRLCNNK